MAAAASDYPTPAAAREWMRNHTSVPLGGLPGWFLAKFRAEGGLTGTAEYERDGCSTTGAVRANGLKYVTKDF